MSLLELLFCGCTPFSDIPISHTVCDISHDNNILYIFPLYRHDIPCRSISHSPFGLVKSSSTQLIILLVNTVNPAKNCIPIEWLGEYTWENWFLEIFNITILLNTWGTILGNSWINITENKLSITYPNFFGYQFSVIKSVVYPKNKRINLQESPKRFKLVYLSLFYLSGGCYIYV